MRKLNQRTHTKTKAAQALVDSSHEALNTGLVVATHGRHCVVELDDGARIICHPRGKKSQAVVGDRVKWQAAADEGTIESVIERRNLFYRRDEVRTKSFAANLDQVLILLAAEPEFSETQLSRALIAAEAEHIKPLIVLNKSDLGAPFTQAWDRLAAYRQMGYAVMPLQLKNAPDDLSSLKQLQEVMHGKTTLILGPSGAGKSTLVNALVPNARALTGEISQALKEVQMEFHDDMAPEISEFKTAMLREVEGAYVTPSDLFSAYQRWSNKTGMRERDVWSKTMLGKKMGAAGYRSKPRSIDGETIRVYSGLELRHKLRGVENIRKKDE